MLLSKNGQGSNCVEFYSFSLSLSLSVALILGKQLWASLPVAVAASGFVWSEKHFALEELRKVFKLLLVVNKNLFSLK